MAVQVAVLGAGGVGGYYAGVLARAGNEVSVIARGAHLAAVQSRGIEVRTSDDRWTVPVRATDDVNAVASAFGPEDVLILAVKMYSLDGVASSVGAFASRGATVLPLLNGVDAADTLIAGGVASDAVMGGVTYLSAARTGHGAHRAVHPVRTGATRRAERTGLATVVRLGARYGVDVSVHQAAVAAITAGVAA